MMITSLPGPAARSLEAETPATIIRHQKPRRREPLPRLSGVKSFTVSIWTGAVLAGGSITGHPQAIIRQHYAGGKFGLGKVVIVVVSQMSEKSPRRADSPGGCQCFVEAHVSGMRRATERIEDRDLNTAHLLENIWRHFLAIIHVG